MIAIGLHNLCLHDATPASFLGSAHVFPELRAHAELVDVDTGELAKAQQKVAMKAGSLGEAEDMKGGRGRRRFEIEPAEDELGKLVEGQGAFAKAIAQAIWPKKEAVEGLLGALHLGICTGAKRSGSVAVPIADDVGAIVFILAK